MKKNRKKSVKPPLAKAPGHRGLLLMLFLMGLATAGAFWWHSARTTSNAELSPEHIVATPTFNRDVAPVVFYRCAPCHRPGQSGPFSLLTFADVKKHSSNIVEVTARRYMPPWLADDVGVEYLQSRRLDAEEIALLRRWVEHGAVEGAPGDLPPLPKLTTGWELGEPDLVLQMPSPFTL